MSCPAGGDVHATDTSENSLVVSSKVRHTPTIKKLLVTEGEKTPHTFIGKGKFLKRGEI